MQKVKLQIKIKNYLNLSEGHLNFSFFILTF